jgi:hypothetical protein
MDTQTPTVPHTAFVRYPREIAANVTLRAAAAALVAPGADPPSRGASIATTTACAALQTRLALMELLADPAIADPAEAAVAVGGLRAVDAFAGTPAALNGDGVRPAMGVLRRAGDRCVAAWRRWSLDRDAPDDPVGVGGALAVAAWCSWAVGEYDRAVVRARHAQDVCATDPLAQLVLRVCRRGLEPAWLG